jgi:quercetin dioxygenase-like cupin family protein
MRGRHLLAFAVSLRLAAAVFAQEAKQEAKETKEMKTKSAPKAAAKAPVFKPAEDLKWEDLDAKGAPGVQIADVRGNHGKGAFAAFIKFPNGFNTPLHTHTADMKITVISGTFVQTPDGKSQVKLGPGSYFLQPGVTYKHVTGCEGDSGCEIFVESTGKFDLKPVEAGKAPAKK